MRKALENFKLELGDKWLGDETVVKVKGEERYLWSIMDYETRRYIASLLTEGRGAKEALSVIKKAIGKAGKLPQKFITDGLESYSKALKELPNNRIEHISNVGLAKTGDSNNRLERLQGTIKNWTKAKRGLKNRSETLLDGYHHYYNFIRPHLALSDKPPMNMNKDGRWLSFIVGE
jgi:transposase-like protein